MYGDGKSDRLIVAEKRSNKDCGAPWLAESVEPSGLTKGNSFQQNRFRTPCRYGSIWTTLNGHEARNRGYCQESMPTSHPQTCKVRWNGYGRQSVCASLPEVGAQCGSPARWDLCGGRPVRVVPTAKAQRIIITTHSSLDRFPAQPKCEILIHGPMIRRLCLAE